jgi:N-acetylmuramoyl-L-alanine amidase-like protein
MQTLDVRREFQGQFAAPRPTTRLLVVHHAAANYTPVNGIDDVRAIARYHVQTRGWSGVGYHEILAEQTPGGPIACYVTSDPLTIRAHIWGRNHEAFGICMAADFTHGLPPQKWIDALSLRLVEARRRWTNATIVGHKDSALSGHGTSCPGERWAAWKPALVRQVDVMLSQLPPPVLDTKRYRAKRLLIPQRQEGGPPYAGELAPGEEVVVDKWYSNGRVHLADGRGFPLLSDLEAI